MCCHQSCWCSSASRRARLRCPAAWPYFSSISDFLGPLIAPISCGKLDGTNTWGHPIDDLEPSAALPVCDVRAGFVLGYDTLQIQFTNTLKQGSPGSLYVLRISQRKRGRGLCEQPPKLLFAVYQALSPQIFSVTDQQIECKEARRVLTAKQQIFERWSTTSMG